MSKDFAEGALFCIMLWMIIHDLQIDVLVTCTWWWWWWWWWWWRWQKQRETETWCLVAVML